MNEFKEMLVYLRKRSGLSQLELAERIGLSKSAISMYEQGARRPSYEMLEALADFFNVDINFLIGRDATPSSGITVNALGFAARYDLLDDHGKAVLDALMELEEKRMEEDYEKEN